MKEQLMLAFVMSLILSFFLVFFSLASFFMTIDYLRNQSVSVSFTAEGCAAFFVLLGWVFVAPAMLVAYKTIRWIESRRALRCAYFLLVYPIILFSYMAATIADFFLPSLLFGFPLFIIGTVFYPYCAFVLNGEVRSALAESLVRIGCYQCSYVFEMHREAREQRCPMCGMPNINPYLPGEEEAMEVEEVEGGETAP